ncbi:unnamed protein product [Amoebophrya sp. A25]|nr:unnamed protein product [Amoebophrya sp. A25]|eukprot:GSA25T00007926001.1
MSNWFDKAKAWTSDAATRASEAASKTLEKTKEKAKEAKEIAKHKLGRTESAYELSRQLEEKARNATTLAAIADLHRSWISALNKKDGPTYALMLSDAGTLAANMIADEATGTTASPGPTAASPAGGEEGAATSSGGDVLVLEEVASSSNGGGDSATGETQQNKTNKSFFSKITSAVSKRGTSNESGPNSTEKNKDLPEGPKRYLSFKQVFLRSRALELSLETILTDEWMRKRFVPPGPDDHSSHSFYFYSLMQNCISCPPEIWGGLLRTATESELLTDYHIRWLSRLFGILKVDWMDEVFHAERKDMAVKAEQLRNEIRGVKTASPSLTDQEIEKHHKKKVNASRDLVQLYKGLRLNMEDALKHRETVLKKRNDNIKLLEAEMQDYREDLINSQENSVETREKLTKELAEASEVLKVDLESIDADRIAVDQEIEELEVRKKNLKLEIEEVTQLLLIARQKQKHFMMEQDAKRTNMYGEKDRFKREISEKERLGLECQLGTQVLHQISQIVTVTEKQMTASLSKQITELAKKRDQFDQHFVEVLRDHCRYEEDRITSIGEIAKVSCGRLIQLSDEDSSTGLPTTGSGKDQATGPGGAPLTRAEFLVRERHIFTRATHDLEVVWTDIVNFRRAHEEQISGSTVLRDSLTRMEQKYRAIRQHLAPGLELMVTSNMGPDSPLSTPGATGPAVGSLANSVAAAAVSTKPPADASANNAAPVEKKVPPPPPPAPPAAPKNAGDLVVEDVSASTPAAPANALSSASDSSLVDLATEPVPPISTEDEKKVESTPAAPVVAPCSTTASEEKVETPEAPAAPPAPAEVPNAPPIASEEAVKSETKESQKNPSTSTASETVPASSPTTSVDQPSTAAAAAEKETSSTSEPPTTAAPERKNSKNARKKKKSKQGKEEEEDEDFAIA